MKNCPVCNAIIDDAAVFCNICGANLQQNANPQPQVQNAFVQQAPNASVNPEVQSPSLQPEAQTPSPQPKKNKKVLIIVLIVVGVLALAGIGFFAQEFFQSKGYGENVNGAIEAVLTGNTIEGEDVFNGERFDEMVWGYYEEESYSYTGDDEAYKTFKEGMEYFTLSFSDGSELRVSALPLDVHFGNYGHFMNSFTYDGEYYDVYTEKGRVMFRKAYMEEYGDLDEQGFEKLEALFDMNVAEVMFYLEDGGTYSHSFAYEIKGEYIYFYFCEIDEEYNINIFEEPVMKCEMLHDGGKLILANEGVQRNYYGNGYKDGDDLNFSGYALNAKNQYEDLSGFAFFSDSVYVELDNGDSPFDPVMEFDKTNGNFVLSWEECYTDEGLVKSPMEIKGTIIPCTNYGFTDYSGFIMIIDGVQYRYLMSKKEFEENQYDGLANGDLSDSELEELAETKRDILAELEQAFKDEGIEATIDYDSGEVVLEESFLFATNSYELSAEGKKYLDSFMNVYTSVVLKEEYSSYIAQIVVEGHTDTSGSYSLNQTLSQNRADAVAQHCITQNPQVKDVMQAIGCSYDYPVYNEDGTVNMDASRRVTFSFVFAG